MTACNSLHNFLNLKLFSKYGTILLVLILVVIIANLMEYNLGLRPYAYRIHNSLGFRDTVEGFSGYGWPNNMYLKVNPGGVESNEKYLYIKGNGQYNLTNLLTGDMKANPYRVFLDGTNLKIRIPVLLSEFLDLLSAANVTLTRDQQSELATNQYVEFEIRPIEATHSTMDKDKTFKLEMVNPDISVGADGTVPTATTITTVTNRLNLILKSGNVIGLLAGIDSNAGEINKKGIFKMESLSEAENIGFQPIIPNTLKMKIHPTKNELDIMFNVDPSQKDIDHFLIVLAKYDYKRNLVGHLKVHTSSEDGASKKNICYMDAGIRKCNYTLTDIDHIDADGNILYYRVGVIPVNND